MIRSYWRDPRFWMWCWRQRVPGDAKVVAAVVGVCLLGFGGYAAAGGLNSAVTMTSESLAAQVTTVQSVVTIRESGRVVTRPVRVVRQVRVDRTVPGRGSTAYETQVQLSTVTTPGSTYVVTRRDVQTVPVFREVVVTRDGRIQTVVQTRAGATQVRTSVVTDRRTVTNERVLTNERVVTSERVVTTERVITRENDRVVTRDRVVTNTVPVTVRSTDTIVRTETETRTLPVTIVETIRRTETETVPVTVVETVPVTVTVTIKRGDG